MDNLSLLYEKQNLNSVQIRFGLIEQLLLAEKHQNYGRINELSEFLTASEENYLVKEGIYDRLKAKGAGLIGKGQQAVGKGITNAGKYVQNVGTKFGLGAPNASGSNEVAQYGQQLQQTGADAKYNSYKNSAIANLVNDFTKLKFNVDMDKFKDGLNSLFDNAVNVPQANPATPPPLPQQPQQNNAVQAPNQWTSAVNTRTPQASTQIPSNKKTAPKKPANSQSADLFQAAKQEGQKQYQRNKTR